MKESCDAGDAEIKKILETARCSNAPCGTLRQLYKLGVRRFYHDVTVLVGGVRRNGCVLLDQGATTDALENLLLKAYGEKAAENVFYQERANSDPVFIRTTPQVLKRYLTHGLYSPGMTYPSLLTSPEDYLSLKVREIIKEVYCAPPEYSSRSFRSLVEKNDQSLVGIVKLLILAFGVRAVKAAMHK